LKTGGWLKCTDELGRPYYFNKATKTSTWGASVGVDDDDDDALVVNRTHADQS
jgi:hypothetical protein